MKTVHYAVDALIFARSVLCRLMAWNVKVLMILPSGAVFGFLLNIVMEGLLL